MRLLGQPTVHRHSSYSQQYLRLDWQELGGNWKPSDNKSQEIFDTWLVTRTGTEAADYQTGIESEQKVSDIEDTVECVSTYHKGDRRVPRLLSRTTRNGKVWCLDCTARMNQYYEAAKLKKVAERQIAKKDLPERNVTVAENNYVVPPLNILPVEDLPQWRVTVVQPTTIVVRAKDFLDAASQLEGKGEIIRVEKL